MINISKASNLQIISYDLQKYWLNLADRECRNSYFTFKCPSKAKDGTQIGIHYFCLIVIP